MREASYSVAFFSQIYLDLGLSQIYEGVLNNAVVTAKLLQLPLSV